MKKTISIILIAVFAAVLGSSTFYIVRHNKEADKQAELYHNLASVVEAAAQTDAEAEPTEPIPYCGYQHQLSRDAVCKRAELLPEARL